MLTGHGESDVVKSAIALDVNGYLVKPVALDKLVEMIEKVLKKPFEAKDPDFYRNIRVPKVSSLNEEPGGKAKPWTVMHAKPFRSEADVKKKLDALKGEQTTLAGAGEIKIKNRRECAINELLEGQILAQDSRTGPARRNSAARTYDQKIEIFARALAQLLRTGDPAFRRAYLQLFIEDIEAKDGQLKVTGSEDALAAAVANGPKLAEGGVHAFVHEWRAIGDSNPITAPYCIVHI